MGPDRHTGGEPEKERSQGRRIRAFLAVPLPAGLLNAVRSVQEDLARQVAGVRWTKPETMHLTLKFFGDIPEESLEKIGELMLSIGHSCRPFSVDISGVGAFPSPARPRVVWLGVRNGAPLVELHETFDRTLAEIGIARDTRPFAPHLTLGRVRGDRGAAPSLPESCREIECGVLPVEKVTLFESRLRPAGALHVPIKTQILGS